MNRTFLVLVLVALIAAGGLLAGFLWLTAEQYSFDQRDGRASALLERGDVEQAMAIWQELLQQKPGDVTLLNRLGIAYTQAKDYTRAESYFRQALAEDPDEPQAYFNLGLLQMKQGQTDQAEATLLRLLAVADWYPQGNYHLGYIYEKSGRLELARKYYIRELNVNGSCAKAWRRYLALKNDEFSAKTSRPTGPAELSLTEQD